MIENTVVIDAVAHGFDTTQPNWNGDGRMAQAIADGLYYGFHQPFAPGPEWVLDKERFSNAAANPELLASAMFGESPTDICVYHEVPLFGTYKNGMSPISTGLEMRRRYPGRVLLYGAVSPWMDDPVATVDRLVDEHGVVGLKLYPMDLYEGKMKPYRYDDPEVAYPIYQRAVERGLKVVAVHKALPLGPSSQEPFRPSDMEGAAFDFPELNFEIVHGGFAFLEETASMIARFPNVLVNLEATAAFVTARPRQFAEIIGTLLQMGGEDRLIWATGCVAAHPKPGLEAFWDFEMPEDLVSDYGMPPLTREGKQKTLSGNLARVLGLDLESMAAQYAGDRFSQQTELAKPWSGGETS